MSRVPDEWIKENLLDPKAGSVAIYWKMAESLGRELLLLRAEVAAGRKCTAVFTEVVGGLKEYESAKLESKRNGF